MELKAAGRTILFASHRMEQVEQLCDDICLISSGRVVLSGSLRAIKKAYGRNHIVVEFEGEDTFVDALEKMGWVKVELRNQHRVELKLLDTVKPAEVLRFILDHVLGFDPSGLLFLLCWGLCFWWGLWHFLWLFLITQQKLRQSA